MSGAVGFVPPVTRKDGKAFGKPTHWYVDGAGRKIPGVTTILKDAVPKPALVGWGIKKTAEYAIDRWDELADLKPSERLAKLKGAAYEDRDEAANRGTDVHSLADQLVRGVEVEVPEALTGHVDAYLRFLEEWRPQPVLVEATVYHLEYGWAGTLDLVADVPDGRRLLMDLKTSRSGVWGETAFQLAMYRWSTHFMTAEGPAPMVEVDDSVVVHVTADGYEVRPVPTGPDVLLQCRYLAQTARAVAAAKDYVGDALAAPVELNNQED